MNLIKTTLVGGAIFLVPFLVLVVLATKAYHLMLKMAVPLGQVIPLQKIGGVAIADIIAILTLVVICYLAGLVAKAKIGMTLRTYVDDKLSMFVPGYTFIKSISNNIAEAGDEDSALTPVLVRFDDQLQAAFELERNDAFVVVFVPDAPNAYSGSVAFVTADRIEALDSSFIAVASSLKRFGKGASSLTDPQSWQSIRAKMG